MICVIYSQKVKGVNNIGFVVSRNLKTHKKYECKDTPCDVVVSGDCTTIGKEAYIKTDLLDKVCL